MSMVGSDEAEVHLREAYKKLKKKFDFLVRLVEDAPQPMHQFDVWTEWLSEYDKWHHRREDALDYARKD